MRAFFRTIDGLLRGSFTSGEALRKGRIAIELRWLVVCGLALGAFYGVFMGLYGALRPGSPSLLQLVMTTAKVPLLFLLTLLVTFPSLYVFSALGGSRLGFLDTMRLLLAGIVVELALLASFGPVTGFFTLSTESYPFMILLNVLFFAVAGVIGLVFMNRALEAIVETVPDETAPEESESSAPDAPDGPVDSERAPSRPEASAAPPALAGEEPPLSARAAWLAAARSARARKIFVVWTVIYGAVGAQMGWILRPFIGSPDLPVELFRRRSSNFFEAVIRTIADLFNSTSP